MLCVNSAKLSILPRWFDRWYFEHTCLIKSLTESSGMYICVSVPIRSFSAFWILENIFPAIVQLPNQTIFLIVLVFKIYYRDMMYEIWNASFCQDDMNKVAIVQCCLIVLLKESLFLSFFVECFLMLILSVLVSWKCDISKSIPLPIGWI